MLLIDRVSDDLGDAEEIAGGDVIIVAQYAGTHPGGTYNVTLMWDV